MEAYETLPIVPLRDVVVFPHMMMPFVVGRQPSTRALEHALSRDKRIFLAAQKDAANDDPSPGDIYTLGCVANIVQSLRLPDGNVKVLVEGVDRARAVEWKEDKGFYRVVAKVLGRQNEPGEDVEAAMNKVVSQFEQYVKLSNNLQHDAMIAAVRRPTTRAKLVRRDRGPPSQIPRRRRSRTSSRSLQPEGAARRASHDLLEAEIEKLQVDRRIQSRVKRQMEKAQKEYYLSEKMKAIQSELGPQGRSHQRGRRTSSKKILRVGHARPRPRRRRSQELKRLEAMPPVSAEATVSRNYLEWLVAVPWYQEDPRQPRHRQGRARSSNEDHHGLEKIKERILEFLAVRSAGPQAEAARSSDF